MNGTAKAITIYKKNVMYKIEYKSRTIYTAKILKEDNNLISIITVKGETEILNKKDITRSKPTDNECGDAV